jgi:hypothetical protein
VALSSDGTRIDSVGKGGGLVMGSKEGTRQIEIFVTPSPRGPAYGWSVNGESRDLSTEGREWRDPMLPLAKRFLQLRTGQPSESTESRAVRQARGDAIDGLVDRLMEAIRRIP